MAHVLDVCGGKGGQIEIHMS